MLAFLGAMSVYPLGHPKGNKTGRCGLCGFTGKLSDTHVPPRAAGNIGEARPAVLFVDDEAGTSTVGFGRATHNGMSGWWLCSSCNNRAGRWEREYLGWRKPILAAIHESGAVHGQRLCARIPSADPGAFVRVLWAWMFAIDDRLLLGFPELAKAVLTGEPTLPPRGLRLLLAATPSPWIAAVKPRRALWTGHGWDPELANQPRVAVSAPPFVVLLAVDGTEPAPGFFDTAAWLADHAGTRRPLTLKLLLVETLTDDDVSRMRVPAPIPA